MQNRDNIKSKTWLPSTVTAANIAAGFAAMLLAADGRYLHAVYMLVLAIVLDVLDGRIARWLNATSAMGRELDSFADLISSGVAPALLVYLAVMRPLGVMATLVAMTYLLAGIFRLARFNLLTDPHSKDDRSCGLPIPAAAGYLMALVLMRDHIGPVVAALVVLAAAMAMVSRWRLPQLTGTGVATGMMVVGILNYLAMVVWPNWYTFSWWNLWNLGILFAAKIEDRRMPVKT